MAYTGDQKRAYQLAWIQKRRTEWIQSQGGACVRCGSTEQLEVDHIDRTTKKVPVSAIWSRSAEFRAAELEKCQVLCTDCHLEKTKKEMPEWMGVLLHGTHGMYTKGCRCTPCTKAHATLAAEYRAAGKKW